VSKSRLEAFSDGLTAILVIVTALELCAPTGTTETALRDDICRCWRA
jgi:uncharacterized membrane protein